jgi:hypothetical protein
MKWISEVVQLGRQCTAHPNASGDELPFPPASLKKRILAWAVDKICFKIIAKVVFGGTLMEDSFGTLLWIGTSYSPIT